ncbi:MAG: hypothetical protein HY332_08825 [Chloroflexi bacterium]|nr:hypothetical protein [Chloroflexota bacterium]
MEAERLLVLKMIEAGAITAEQAVELLRVLEQTERTPGAAWRASRSTGSSGAASASDSTAGTMAPDRRSTRGGHPPSIALRLGRPANDSQTTGTAGPHWLRIRVVDRHDRSKLNVQLPIGIIGLALRLGARWIPELRLLDPDLVLATVLGRPTGTLFQASDEAGGDRVELILE